jgi:hypothetical protein
MAVRTPPSWILGQSHTAENDRLTATQGLISVAGVRQTTAVLPQAAAGTCTGDYAVTQSGTPAMTVQIAAGWAYVQGTVSSTQGMYGVYNDGAVTLSITANSSGSTRNDLVYLKITDTNYGDASSTASLLVQTGSLTVPASSVALAQIAVANGATSITNSNITDLRVGFQTNAVNHPLYPINAQTGTSYPLVASDVDKVVQLTNASGITLTVPTNASVPFPVGTTINLLQGGAGQVTVSSSDTINTAVGLKLRATWSMATLVKIASTTWVLTGDTTT